MCWRLRLKPHLDFGLCTVGWENILRIKWIFTTHGSKNNNSKSTNVKGQGRTLSATTTCVLMSLLFLTFHHAPSWFPLSLTLPFAPAAQGFSFSRAGSTKMCQYVCQQQLITYVCLYAGVCVYVYLGNCNYGPAKPATAVLGFKYLLNCFLFLSWLTCESSESSRNLSNNSAPDAYDARQQQSSSSAAPALLVPRYANILQQQYTHARTCLEGWQCIR